MLYLSKAFDNVQHQTLPLHLGKKDFAGTVLTWFHSYLSNRFQRVAVGGHAADLVPVTKGFLQGRILGPLLFNLYLAHLPSLVESLPVHIPSYADDVSLSSVAGNPQEAMALVSKATSAVCTNLGERGLIIYVKKSCVVLIGRNSADRCEGLQLTYKDIFIPTVLKTGLLCVMLDDHLPCEDEVYHIVTKVGRKLGAFHRARRLLNAQARRMYLLSVIIPDLDYCCLVFAFCLRAADRQKLETLERRAIRICVGADSLAPCDQFYTELKILPLKVRWMVRALCCTYEAVNGMRPTAVCSMFDRQSHRYQTRGTTSSTLLPRRAGHEIVKRSFSFRSSLLWNSLSSAVRNVVSMSEFKRCLLSLSESEMDKLLSLAYSALQT